MAVEKLAMRGLELYAVEAEITESGCIAISQSDSGGDHIVMLAPEQVDALVQWLQAAQPKAQEIRQSYVDPDDE